MEHDEDLLSYEVRNLAKANELQEKCDRHAELGSAYDLFGSARVWRSSVVIRSGRRALQVFMGPHHSATSWHELPSHKPMCAAKCRPDKMRIKTKLENT